MNYLYLSPKEKINEITDFSEFSNINNFDFTEKKIGEIKILVGKKNKKIKDLFLIKIKKIQFSLRKIVIKGTSKYFKNMGKNWTRDHLEIFGNLGSNLGNSMKGGKIKLNGSCGDFLGCKMTGGLIMVSNNAGNYIGSADYGERKGMNGGVIVIKGNAGDYLGYMMRRGLIFVEGNSGDFSANNMIAGTIIIIEKLGKNYGIGMKRGTIITCKKPKKIDYNFFNTGTHEFNFFVILENYLKQMGVKMNINFLKFEKFIEKNNGLAELLIVNK